MSGQTLHDVCEEMCVDGKDGTGMPELNELALAEQCLEEAKKHIFAAVAAEPLLGAAGPLTRVVMAINVELVELAIFRNAVYAANHGEYDRDG